MKYIIVVVIGFLVLPWTAVGAGGTIEVPVLLYHYVRPQPNGDRLGSTLSINPENFHRQIIYLLSGGYRLIRPAELRQALGRSTAVANKSIILTFDDGTADFASTVFPLLQAYGIPGTVFVVAGFVSTPGYITWEEVRLMAHSPLLTIGTHGLNHVSFPRMRKDIADRQLQLSRNILEAVTGRRIETVAYPNGEYTSQTITGVEAAGYTLGFSTLSGTAQDRHRPFELRRVRAGPSVATLRSVLR